MPYTQWLNLNESIKRQRLSWVEISSPLLQILVDLDDLRQKGEIPEGTYRQKGNLFKDTIIALVLAKCEMTLTEKRVKGMTDIHNVDLCYLDPQAVGDADVVLIAGEVKAMGSPHHHRGGEAYPERTIGIDIDKRFKEVKYTPIDLKRRFTPAKIGNWETWLTTSRPFFFSAWLMRLAKKDNPGRIVKKLHGLADYNNGVGVALFRKGWGETYEWMDWESKHPRLGDVGRLVEMICEKKDYIFKSS